MNLHEAINSLPDTDKNVLSVLSGGLDSGIMTMLLVQSMAQTRCLLYHTTMVKSKGLN